MRVLLVHTRYLQKGGEDAVFEHEAAMLARYGHTVSQFVRHNEALQGQSMFRVAANTWWNSAIRQELRTTLLEQRPDVVHVHNTFPLLSPSIYSVCTDVRVPVVQTLHNYRLICPNALLLRNARPCELCLHSRALLPALRYRCYRDSRRATSVLVMMLLLHRALRTWERHVTRFIALNDHAKKLFVSCGIPADRIHVKPNSLPDRPVPPAAPKEPWTVVFAGRFSPEKGLDVLLPAWHEFLTMRPTAKARLRLFGQGPELERVLGHMGWPASPNDGFTGSQEAARELPDRITVSGHRPAEEVAQAVEQAHLVVLPSRCYECCPMLLLEAMRAGRPALVSRLGAMAEMTIDGETGVHFTSGNPRSLAEKFAWAYDHPLELAQMGDAARKRFDRHYNENRNMRRLSEIYAGVIGERVTDARSARESS